MNITSLYNLGHDDTKFSLNTNQLELVEQSYRKLLSIISNSTEIIYGLHTGYGANVTQRVDPKEFSNHQYNLLKFLCVGVGNPLPEKVVRRALKLQLLKVAKGVSGIHPDTVNSLINLVNSNNLVQVPRYGSLGASGDLIPMAHAISPLFSVTRPKGPRDVIGLVNTNSMMASLAIEVFKYIKELVYVAGEITALASIGVGSNNQPFSKNLLETNQDPYQAEIGEFISDYRYKFLNSINDDNQSTTVQVRYSIRCAPQILGAVLSHLEYVEKLIISESLAVADNPIMPLAEDKFYHGGLFYTSKLAMATDICADSIVRICELLERQTFILVTPDISNGLPPNLEIFNGDHLKGVHQLVNSLGQKIRGSLSSTRYLSAPAESYNQDVVPCTMVALTSLEEIILIVNSLIKGCKFIANRAALIKANLEIPQSLYLNQWSNYHDQF
jgi:histidine ammonia-lyase